MSALQKDFQETLQAAALQFLLRHQSEHLGHDTKLLDRAALFLVNDFQVLDRTAERIVILAVSDLAAVRDRQRLDLMASSGTLTVIVDPITGTAWAIPVSLIYERIISAPDNGRLRITNS